jgi:hypothetical protein
MRAPVTTLVARLALGLVLGLGAALVGCEEDDPCGPDLEFERGYCRPLRPDAGGGPPATADAGPGFGTPCAEDQQCGGMAPRCFRRPEEAMGFCSATDCDKMPAICPAGWLCFDLSIIVPGSPHGCVKPP